MSKLAVILCVALLASAANASYLLSTVEAAQQRVGKIIDAAVEDVKTRYADAKQQAQDISDKLYQAGVEHAQKLADELTAVLVKVQGEIDKVTGKAEGVDVTECTKLAAHLDFTAMSVLSNISTCVVDKIETGAGYVESMVYTFEEVLTSLSLLRNEAHHCGDDVTGVLSAAKAVACVNFVGVRVGVVTAKAIPSVAIDIGKLNLLLTTLQPSLVYCSAKSGLVTFHHEAGTVVQKTKYCVQEKIDKHRDAEPDSHSSSEEDSSADKSTSKEDSSADKSTTKEDSNADKSTTKEDSNVDKSTTKDLSTDHCIIDETSTTPVTSTTEAFYSTEEHSANDNDHHDEESTTETEADPNNVYIHRRSGE